MLLVEFLSIGGAWRSLGLDLLTSHDVERLVQRTLADLSWIYARFKECMTDFGFGRLNLWYSMCLGSFGRLKLSQLRVWKAL